MERALAIRDGRRTDRLRCAPYEDWQKWESVGVRNQRSPLRAIEAIRAAVVAATFDEGLAEEARLFEEALLDEQAGAMVYLFFAERELGKAAFLPKDAEAAEIEREQVAGDEIEIEAGGKCRMRVSPAEFGAKVVEVKWESGMSAETLAAALQYVKKMGKLAVICSGGEWLGRRDLNAESGAELVACGSALRASDLDVLMVRGFGYPEETGGPMYFGRGRS
jgi:hypothetical protein